jgi:biopolymer transport protein ExbD
MQTGIKVNLPEVVSPELQPREHLVVTLNTEGRVFLNEKEVSWEDLPVAIEEMIGRVPSGVVVIRGDRDVSLGHVVRAMEIAKASGALRLAVAVKPSFVETQK